MMTSDRCEARLTPLVVVLLVSLLFASSAFAGRTLAPGGREGSPSRTERQEAAPACCSSMLDGPVNAGTRVARIPLPPGRAFPPNLRPYGMTYGEWQVREWTVFMQFTPFDSKACVIGETDFGAAGKVLHFNSSGGTPVELDCTLTSKDSLAFPLIIYFAPPELGCPGGCLPKELKALADEFIDQVRVLEVELDGKPVEDFYGNQVDWFEYRAVGPVASGYSLPGSGLDPILVGPFGPSAFEGYYAVLSPLPPGEHVLHIFSDLGVFGQFETTLFITVTP